MGCFDFLVDHIRIPDLLFPYSTWYFFAVFNYFLYGEVIIYYFKHIVLVDAYFVPFVKHHRFISFCLYTMGFVGFVGTLRRDALKTQFGLFAWVHISLFLVILSR